MYYGMELIIEKCLWGRCNTMFAVFAQLCKQSEWITKTKWKRDKTSNCKWEKIQRGEQRAYGTEKHHDKSSQALLFNALLPYSGLPRQTQSAWQGKHMGLHVDTENDITPRNQPWWKQPGFIAPNRTSVRPWEEFIGCSFYLPIIRFRGQYLEKSTWLISL